MTKDVTKWHPLERILKISDYEVSVCWSLSKLTVKDMKRDYGRTQHMVFVEFLEFICRVAHVAHFSEKDKRSSIRIKRSHSSDIEPVDFELP